MALLMYADDIVLLADKKAKLQGMLQVVSQDSREWRFKLNRDKGKSEVVAFGIGGGEATTWTLGGGEISQVDTYKYLGIELGRKLDFKDYKKRALKQPGEGSRNGAEGRDVEGEGRRAHVEDAGETGAGVWCRGMGRGRLGGGRGGPKADGETDPERE